jgi:serine phosphatase RsbU (regulator of sigma subunit)
MIFKDEIHLAPVIVDVSGKGVPVGAVHDVRKKHDQHGFVLGGMKRSRHVNYELQPAPGGTVFDYIDGITEASDEQRQLYGTDRLLDALN